MAMIVIIYEINRAIQIVITKFITIFLLPFSTQIISKLLVLLVKIFICVKIKYANMSSQLQADYANIEVTFQISATNTLSGY